jgi:Protein of unknown function (DUF3309)
MLTGRGRRNFFKRGCVEEPENGLKEIEMLSTILVVVLILLLIGALPTWGYSGGWGYGPGGIVGVLLIVVIVLALTGRI